MKKNNLKVKDLDDSALVSFILKRHQENYREIINRYQKKLFSYLYRLVRNKEEVEDILQNVFVKVFKNLDSFDTKKKFSPWIYRIAHNEAINFLKRRNKKQFISWEDMANENKSEARSEEKSPFDAWISKESDREVRKAMQALPVKYREILEMRYFQEKTYSEIGKVIKKPVNTVGTLLSRAKNKLLGIIGEKK
jgi:RNA polymerase sigma-70 factor (ECF subfamily)